MQKPPFLPIGSQGVDRQTCQAAYSMIAAVLRRLQKEGSYGGLFQVLNEDFRDYSPAVVLGIPGSAFTLDKAVIPEGFKLRVVIRNDKMVMVSADRWSLQAIRDVPLAIREVSLGELRQLNEAGSFGGYFAKKGSPGAASGVDSAIIGVTAAHVVPTAKAGTLLTSPSTLELTGRLRLNLPYSERAPPETRRHLVTGRDNEVKEILSKYRLVADEGGLSIQGFQRKVVPVGRTIGVTCFSTFYKRNDILSHHNRLLAAEEAPQFELPETRETQVDVAGFYTVREWYAQQCSHRLLHLLTFIDYAGGALIRSQLALEREFKNELTHVGF